MNIEHTIDSEAPTLEGWPVPAEAVDLRPVGEWSAPTSSKALFGGWRWMLSPSKLKEFNARQLEVERQNRPVKDPSKKGVWPVGRILSLPLYILLGALLGGVFVPVAILIWFQDVRNTRQDRKDGVDRSMDRAIQNAYPTRHGPHTL